jgi:hypothetical protein
MFNMGIAVDSDRDKGGDGVPGVKVGKDNWDGRKAQISPTVTTNFNPKK